MDTHESVFVINMTQISVEKLSLNEFIEHYGRRVGTPEGPALEYQYDEATGELWRWDNGYHATIERNVEKEVALLKLFAKAMFEAENHAEEGVLVFVDKEEALDFVQEGIENEDVNVEELLALSEKLLHM